MKLSLNWLNSYFQKSPDWDDILYKLTQAGIEVEDIETTPEDKIVEFKITPNRGDVLSVTGLLREITVLSGLKPLKPAHEFDFKPSLQDKVQIEVREQLACPSYLALVIKNVDNRCVLPTEIVERLISSGTRPVSPVVDITNYVMLELGQPLHAFDLNQINDKLIVRFAKNNEELDLLAGITAKLTDKTLIICDSKDKAAAIAGVMGGVHSGVNETTDSIILESAFFTPEVIASKAKYYGVTSDSAYRFERGVDPRLQELALKYAASLIVKYCGGEIGEIAQKTADYNNSHIQVSYSSIDRLLGVKLSPGVIQDILSKLGFIITQNTNDDLSVIVPSHRFDITIKEDVIEEIARVYGYDNIEAKIPVTGYTMRKVAGNIQKRYKTALVNLGYTEIISYAFVEDKLEALAGDPKHEAVKLKNPIANLNVMRTSLIGDLLKVLRHNLNYGHKRLRIFELARVFYGETKEEQPLKLAGLAYGSYLPASWCSDNRPVDFYDVRNDIENLLGHGREVKFSVYKDNPLFHSGRCAKISVLGKDVGIVGQLHPRYRTEFDLVDLPYLFEIDMVFLLNQVPDLFIHEVSKFQKVERDLAFLVEANINSGDLLEAISAADIPFLIESNIFDIYQGDKLTNVKLAGRPVKSVAINFLFQGNKTLSEEEINISIAKITQCILANFTAQLRI